MSDKLTVPFLPHVALDASLVVVSSKPATCGIVTYKVKVPTEHFELLDHLAEMANRVVKRMLNNRNKASSKFYKEIPCVIAKSLSLKYQRNSKCKSVSRICLPVCGDKGKQVKQVEGGIRVPALFKKSVIACSFPLPVLGFIRQVELFRRNGEWFMSYTYNTPCAAEIKVDGVIGVDRNSVGNIAVLADPQNGKVRKFGICPARTKAVMRGRRKNLQKAGKFRLLSKLRLKQSRRMTHENHRVSKSVVDYATKHCRAVVIEKLEGVNATGSKIRHYSEKNQWAFAQLETFLRYKCALRGVPVIAVSPAYTSQTCSHCGSRHKPNGKVFSCGSCGRTYHRDVNASFNIAKLGLACIGGSGGGLNVSPSRPIGGPQTGKDGA